MHILLITADEATARTITVELAATAALGRASLHGCDAIVIDAAVPGPDALDTAAKLHGLDGRVPVLLLSPLAGRDSASLGFGVGRDDVPRALALDDLAARLDLLRREGDASGGFR